MTSSNLLYTLLFSYSIICIVNYHLSSITVFGQSIKFGKISDKVSYANPDQAGYHHCAFWRLSDGQSIIASCTPFTLQRCGKKLEFDYKCCAGYEKIGKLSYTFRDFKKDECALQVSPYELCMESIRNHSDVYPFAEKMKTLNEFNTKNPDKPYTIFAPSTRNAEKYKDFTNSAEHIVPGRFYLKDLKSGLQLNTLDPKRKLYVTRELHGTVSVDCVELVDADMECNSGIIHTIRYPLTDTQKLDRSSILSLLESNSETQSFAKDLSAALKNNLKNINSGHRYTVIVPSQKSWELLRQKYSSEQLQRIAANHVILNQHCSGHLIQSLENYKSLLGEKLEFICETDSTGKERHYVRTMFNDKHELTITDLTSSNGVAHIIEEPLIPFSVMTFRELLQNKQYAEKLKSTEFLKLLAECDLKMEPGEKYAIVLPQDSSMKWWSTYSPFQDEYKRFQADKEYRCRVARYHVVKSDNRLNNIGNFASHTLGHRTINPNEALYETTYFKKTPYGSQLNFHYSPVNNLESYELDDVTIYVTPRINVPPEVNMTDIINNRADTTITKNQTERAKMDEKYFRKNAPKNLFLVTTDNGWKDPRATQTTINPYKPELNMYTDKNLENYLLLNHIPLYLWGGDIGYFEKNTVHKFMSSAGIELIFWMDNNAVMRIGYEGLPRDQWPKVIHWNLHARDGIIWVLDGLLKCPEKLCPLLAEDVDYYDVYVMACQTSNLPGEKDAVGQFESRPLDIASRHPNLCTVVLQTSETTVTLIET
ncbi:gynecophoral canal protein [Schistosoma japonicum]|nr:gynecophoral canal protein [Schistosoma japonicum]